MFRNLKKWDYKNDEREIKFLVGKLGTLVGQFFSTGEAHAPPVKQLKNALLIVSIFIKYSLNLIY